MLYVCFGYIGQTPFLDGNIGNSLDQGFWPGHHFQPFFKSFIILLVP